MSEASKLYTPELLALAVELANWPPVETLPLHGEARSPTCGSTIAMDLETDAEDRIAQLGMRVRACAVGQATAAIFARHAKGRDFGELQDTLVALVDWLGGKGPLPDWPGLAAIEPARAYPGRHGAILLPWQAALSALSSTPLDR
jgi:NifU-like protein involved in Fe-S cluster formation